MHLRPQRGLGLALAALAFFWAATPTTGAPEPETPGASQAVTVGTFIRAETDTYFAKTVDEGAFGVLRHSRQMAPIDKQTVVRMNRDTLYSDGVFDLNAAPVTITLPDTGKRFMSMQVVSEDHYTTEVVYSPGRHTYDKENVGTRYVFIIIRTLANPEDAADVKAANALQDQIEISQAVRGSFQIPHWEPESQAKVRDALAVLATLRGEDSGAMFGAKNQVDPVNHLIGTAIGWGGNPPAAAIYNGVFPKSNDGKTIQQLTVKDVPVDGFWSISVYNSQGFFEKNELGAYSLNSITAKPNADHSYTVRFGGCSKRTSNCLPIMSGWNYTVRMYRPRAQILNGVWKFPEARPVT